MAGEMKRIGFVSTRIAGTDGVSLETYKWMEVLRRNGYECFFFAGELATPEERSMLEPMAHFAHPEVLEIHEVTFGRTCRPRSLSSRMHEMKDLLKDRLYAFQRRFDIELLIPENVLAIPMHIPLGMAVTEFLAETGLPCVAHHHDFSWERDRFILNCVSDYLDYAFPPSLPNIRHVVINTRASRQLSFRRGMSNRIIYNVFDFKTIPSCRGDRCEALRRELGFGPDELFVLQPTRVVPRKGIERAVELVALLGLERPRLVVSHEWGDEGEAYKARVVEHATRMGVELLFIGDRVGSSQAFGANHDKPYTIDDVYQSADLVTYPSFYEGFGNAFLEAIYFKRPLVVNRYSIYVEDIEPKGFDVVSFEGFVTDDVVERVREVLEPPRRREAVERNYALGERFFSYEVLERELLTLIRSFA